MSKSASTQQSNSAKVGIDEQYMAPEQFMLDEHMDQRAADIWALGCVFAEVVYCLHEKYRDLDKLKNLNARKLACKEYLEKSQLFGAASCN